MSSSIVESRLTVPVGVLPGTDAERLAQQLADALVHLPVCAGAAVGCAAGLDALVQRVRQVADLRGMPSAAQDTHVYAVCVRHRADELLFPADPDRVQVAAALHRLWDERVRGADSGLIEMSVLPPDSKAARDGWNTMALLCPWAVRTAHAPDELFGERGNFLMMRLARGPVLMGDPDGM